MKRELAALETETPSPAVPDSSAFGRKTRFGKFIDNGVSPERLVYKRVKRSAVKAADSVSGPVFRGVVEVSKEENLIQVDSCVAKVSNAVEEGVKDVAGLLTAEVGENGAGGSAMREEVAGEAEVQAEVGSGNDVEAKTGLVEEGGEHKDERAENGNVGEEKGAEGSLCKSPAKRVYGKRKKSGLEMSERRFTRSTLKPSAPEEANVVEEKANGKVVGEKAGEMLVEVNVVEEQATSEIKAEVTCNREVKDSAAEEGAKEGNAKPKEETDSCLTESSDTVMPNKEASEEAGVSLENVECNLLETHVEEAETMSAFPSKKFETSLSYPIGRVRAPQTVRELFETGLLEGCPVYYDGGKGPTLRGKIRSIGILCPCNSCRDCKVVPPSTFEIHASNRYRRAVEYIYLENGRSLIQVLKACRMSGLKTAEEKVYNAIGPVRERKVVSCLNCKEQYATMDVECSEPVCSSCILSNMSPVGPVYAARRLCRAPKFVFPSQVASESDMLQACSQEKIVVESELQLSAKKSAKKSYTRKVRCSPQIRKTSRKKFTENLAKNSQDASLEPKTCSSSVMRKYSSTKASKKLVKKSFEAALSPKTIGLNHAGKSSQKDAAFKTEKRLRKEVLTPKPFKNPSINKSAEKKSTGKITRKDTRLHKLVFEDDVLPDGTELAYFVRGQKLLDGFKKGSGIFCNCCETVVSPSLFEAHAGCAARRKPYCYIYTSNGVSLHELSINLIKSRRQSLQYNDDLCSICADGGKLLLCDSCPRAFHMECASLSSMPRGKWYCKYCESMFEREKFVSFNDNAVAAGRVSGVDPMEQISERSIRIVNSVGSEVSSCILCRQFDFCKSGFGPRTIILCDQCEKEYHVGCLKDHNMADLTELPDGKWFCSMDCGRIDSALHKLLIQGAEKLPESLVNIIRRKNLQNGSDSGTNVDISWRLLSGKIASPETRPLLSQAVAIFHESFAPIIDVVSGHDLIPAMVYGRNVGGQEYGGMYCAVLTINSVVVSAGIFRVFGPVVAELPLVATSSGNHGKGYFQALFASIERQLALLEVKNFVLPAAEEAVSIWTDRFGFTKMTHDQIRELKRNYWSMVRFQGTSMLHKSVPACQGVRRPC